MAGFVYDTEAEYQAAMDEWTRKKAGGDPFPGPTPQRGEKLTAENEVNQAGFDPRIKNFADYQSITQQGANAPPRVNPYNAGIADQSRGAQLALMQQMRGMQTGPSVAAMQGQRAMGQMGQQALMQGGRAGMLGAQAGGAGLAGDVAQARLAEMMRSQAGIGGAAGNLRGGDLRSAEASSRAGLQMRGLDEAARRFYASQGTNLQQSQERADLELFKLKQRKLLDNKDRQMKALNNATGMLATTAGGLV